MTCQTTAETSIAYRKKSAVMKLTKRKTGKSFVSTHKTTFTENGVLLLDQEGQSCFKMLMTFLKQRKLVPLTQLFTPVHVQDGAASCTDVTDDHRGWKDTLSVF